MKTKASFIITFFFQISIFLIGIALASSLAFSQNHINPIAITQKSAEDQIQRLIEPLINKYCHDSCKVLGINVKVDVATSDTIAPGFDDLDIKKADDLAPSSAKVKLLLDDKIGPVSKAKLLDLIQQYLDTLDYPVKIDVQTAHFPMPIGSENKISELRDRISKQFLSTVEELLRQFCPNHCILADFNLQTDIVNGEEVQYGSTGEFLQEGTTAIKIRDMSATLLLDESLSKEEQNNILEMARLKTNSFKHVTFNTKVLKFPRPVPIPPNRKLASEASPTQEPLNQKAPSEINPPTQPKVSAPSPTPVPTPSESTSPAKVEKSERDKLEQERTEMIQAEFQKLKYFGILFACSAFALLIFIALSTWKTPANNSSVHKIIQSLTNDPLTENPTPLKTPEHQTATREEKTQILSKRYEVERLLEELTSVFSEQPKVAKQVFSKVLTEEGVEVTAEYIHLFGEGIIVDMLRDPSLQSDVTELLDYYAKNPIELADDQKLDLLRKLHNRTIVGKLAVLGNRSSNLFDFLSEMDGLQILELIRTESLTVKSIVLTQCDPQKRAVVYAQMDPEYRLQLLTELSRIDYLPKDYIFNVATALKRKRKENPKLNTEALPGSEVLVSLLERTGHSLQKSVVKSLENTNPDSARTIKSKLVSIDTLKYLRDGQLLEVVLSLKHDELIPFLKGVSHEIKETIYSKAPQDLSQELEEELATAPVISREVYQAIERKILNRIKLMASEGQINLIETNERMFSDNPREAPFVQTTTGNDINSAKTDLRKVVGW